MPTPAGCSLYGDCHEHLFPNVYQSPEGITVAGCFKQRRHSTVSSVDALYTYVHTHGATLSASLWECFRRGGNAWFEVSPHMILKPAHPDVGIKWTQLKPKSSAIRETLD